MADDDEMPLTALAKPKKSSFGDDVPLAALAAPGGAKKTSGRPSLGKPPASKPAEKKVGAPAGVKRPLKKKESSSSSDSSSSSSDSSSDTETKKPRKSRPKLRQDKNKDEDNEDNKIAKKTRGTKEQVAVELLCRWWYALPDWPPQDDEGKKEIQRKLKEQNLRQVSIQEWEWVPEVDDKGRKKVYELTQFRGIFRASDGTKYDLRPMDTCPSLNNMLKKDISELYKLLVKAYEGQLEDLKKSKYDETDLRNKLNVALTKTREKAHQAEQMTFNAGLRKKA